MGPGERNYHEQVDPITRDKRADIIPRSALRRQQIKLDNALAAAPFRLRGDVIFLDRASTGLIQVQLNQTSEDLFPMAAGDGIEGLPFEDFFVTSAAQPGLVANVWYGYSARFKTLQSVNTPRAADYDRAPQQRSSGSFAQLTPVHADQQTFIYTVPANRKFNLDLIALALTRDTAAGGTLSVLLRILFTPSGGSQQMLASLTHVNAALDTNRSFTSAGKIILLPGDVIEGRSQDLNAAGTHTRMVVFHGTEFDA
ncbi:MAG TPA: hypothetical protein VEM38_07630 [Burkholderiales bacterium]|nr:hypothetical protein [Burkholderiales bacterium]